MVSYKELINFIWQSMKPQKWVFILILLGATLYSLNSLIWPYILRLMVDVFTKYEGNRLAAWDALRGPIIEGISLVFGIEIAARLAGFLKAKALPKFEANMRARMFDHVQRHSPNYFDEKFADDLAKKVTDMVSRVSAIMQALFWPIIPAVAGCFLGSILLWFISPIFGYFMLGWVLIHIGVCLQLAKKFDVYERKHAEAGNSLNGKIADSFTNNFGVNLFYRFEQEKNYVVPFQEDESAANWNFKKHVEKLRCALSSVYLIGIFLGMNGFILYQWIHGFISSGEVVQVIKTLWNLSMILWGVGETLPRLLQACGMAKQSYFIMKDPQDIQDNPEAKKLVISSGEIIFDNVSFQHGEEILFQNQHVHIRGGEKVGLVGYTGAGKTTFIKLLLRFYPLNSGKITIDGQEISEVFLESLRNQITLIPKDPILFRRTLRENIHYGNLNASDEDVIRAAKLAHCDEFIADVPGGYEAKVGENGTRLSGLEMQQIIIARAILRASPILILDEATSILDPVMENHIQDSLDKLMQNHTVLVIARRLSMLSRMDRILVFDQGKIVEEGTHASLLDKGGLYARMCKMQVDGFLPEVPS